MNRNTPKRKTALSNKTPAPKTITLYGRGKRRFPVFPGVWEHCMKEARCWKIWGKRVKNDQHWKDHACAMSLEHLAHVLATDVTELAKEGYRYFDLRARLGNPQCWDRPARKLWIELGGRIRQPCKARKHVCSNQHRSKQP